jgi:uncharacterized protein YceK
MPGRRWRLAVVAAVALSGGGCGTCVNVTNFAPEEIGGGRRAIYGGVVWDVENLARAVTTPQPRYWLGVNLPMIVEHTIDTPLSAIGDTFTLPITVGQALGFYLPPWPDRSPMPPPPGWGAKPQVVGPAEVLPAPRVVGPPPREVPPSPYK